MPDLTQLAAGLVDAVHAGERASTALSEAIGRERLGPEQAEELARLVYGALRREQRLVAALRELGVARSGARALVIAGALLERRLEPSAARALMADVAWERFEAADASVVARASGVEKVALLGSLPRWLAERLSSEYADAEALAASLSEPAPRALRVNALVADVQQAREQLGAEGARVTEGRWAKRALVLSGAFNPFVTRAFHDGVFEQQDEGSQIVCELVAPPPRGLVVDACAGAGGKSLAVAAALGGRGKLLSLDVDAGKLAELRRRAKRARAVNVQALNITEEGELPEAVSQHAGKVERLLIDAPCSGTGVLRRNPEARARLSPEAISRLVITQTAIVERMLPLLAPGGRLVFATCSLLRAEGEELFDELEARHPELEPVNLAEVFDRAYVDRFVRSAGHRLRLLPHVHETDGFFVTCLRRRRG
jgi:16S rRNA (cytosine967-C5)-methyltransferase